MSRCAAASCCCTARKSTNCSKTRERGLTVVPTKLYLKNGLIKMELAVGKGKKLHDKRESEREREMKAEARAALGRRRE